MIILTKKFIIMSKNAKNDIFITELDENTMLGIMYNKLSFFVENDEK